MGVQGNYEEVQANKVELNLKAYKLAKSRLRSKITYEAKKGKINDTKRKQKQHNVNVQCPGTERSYYDTAKYIWMRLFTTQTLPF